jgi:hypothetical protein
MAIIELICKNLAIWCREEVSSTVDTTFDVYVQSLSTVKASVFSSHELSQIIIGRKDPFLVMGNELRLQQQTKISDIETEIECPRCYDVMTLSSDFDKLYYFCEECNLSLLIN